MLAAGRIGEVEPPAPAVAQVDLALDQFVPGRRGGVLEVGHEHLGARIERVDDHLGVGRPGDLDPPVLQVGGDRRRPSSRRRGCRACLRGSRAARRRRSAPAARARASSSAWRRSSNRSCSSARKSSASGVRTAAGAGDVRRRGRHARPLDRARSPARLPGRSRSGSCAPQRSRKVSRCHSVRARTASGNGPEISSVPGTTSSNWQLRYSPPITQ